MTKTLSRRDFLKLAGLLPLSMAAPRFVQTSPTQKNVLIIVFDAFSAYNISLYGYSRETTPNLAKLADRAVVYHKHYAGGNYTTTGTATLLTGTNAWTHRAFQNDSGVATVVEKHNIFNAFQKHYRMGYSHNILANTLMKQFQTDIEDLIPREQLLLNSLGGFIQTLFGNDEDLASVGWRRNIQLEESNTAYSLLLSRLYAPLQAAIVKSISSRFPLGIPTANSDDRFVLEDAIDYTVKALTNASQPFLGYFHYLPPHAPYRTTGEFFGHFNNDGYVPPKKPLSIFNQKQDRMGLYDRRTKNDEFILYVDKEFGRLYDMMESAGLLENTIVVLTSDHGEMNERGISGHSSSAMYEPVVRVPLVIFEPGRKERVDIKIPTSAADVLPTLLHMSGQNIPDWSEGVVLPPFNSAAPDPDRSIFILRAIKSDQDKPLTNLISIALIKGKYKLHYYLGYPEVKKTGVEEVIYLFDVEADPEELVDLAESHKDIADAMLKEIKAKLAEANQPYM
jgi:arylsulfatase A-like enzyme